MNHSIFSADRTTHVKIVALTLAMNIGLASFVISVRIHTGEPYSPGEQLTQVASPVVSCCEAGELLCPTHFPRLICTGISDQACRSSEALCVYQTPASTPASVLFHKLRPSKLSGDVAFLHFERTKNRPMLA
jgi:hypothetical protein